MLGGLLLPTKKKVKCPACQVFFYRDEEQNVFVKNRYWHVKCYEEYKEKQDQSLKSIEELEKYICDLFGIDYVNARIKKQIKDMVEQYHFTYSGIHGTLRYWYEVKQNSIDKANGGIGIVPYVYEDASKYYETIFYAQQLNKDLHGDSFISKEKDIVIKSPKIHKKMKIVDLDFLEKENDGEEW